ncbi:sigma-54-dependent transcriptional regulator [Methylocella sp.]|uniref:sigma-54-dependent transcriptional regulator n=1 Tax=Methylocella sp. TaxID=1978226 RepID=UPI0035B3581D
MPPKILIVDADPVERLHVEACVRRFGFAAEALAQGAEALARLRAPGAERPDLIILDIDAQGFELLAALDARGFPPPAIVLACGALAQTPGPALDAGAFDVLRKPPDPERLKASIRNALRAARLEDELRRLARRDGSGASLEDFHGASPQMIRALDLAARAARETLPVLVEGEAGVGKETLARAIHAASARRERPFLALRCAAHAPGALEPALFGGPDGDGLLAQARGGTLFLGDVCALPDGAQARLLDVLDAGETRVMAATRRNLIERAKAGRLREDLYFRLAVGPIFLPPLRRRVDEIDGLAAGFCARACVDHGRFPRAISAPALALLRAYGWPGNVGELARAVERAAALARGGELGIEDFPAVAARVEGFLPFAPPLARAADARGAQGSPFLRLLDDDGEARPLAELEEQAIRFALERYHGRMSKMAKALGVGRSTLYRKLKDYGLAGSRGEAEPSPAQGGAPRPDAAA